MAIDHNAFWEHIVEEVNAQRFAILDEVFTEDFVEEYPQSGEVIRGRKNHRAILESYPRHEANLAVDTTTVRSQADDAFKLVGPTYTIVKVHGGGDSGVLTMKTRYPDGSIWWVVRMYVLKGGLVARATTFFAPEFPAPEWRATFVEHSG